MSTLLIPLIATIVVLIIVVRLLGGRRQKKPAQPKIDPVAITSPGTNPLPPGTLTSISEDQNNAKFKITGNKAHIDLHTSSKEGAIRLIVGTGAGDDDFFISREIDLDGQNKNFTVENLPSNAMLYFQIEGKPSTSSDWVAIDSQRLKTNKAEIPVEKIDSIPQTASEKDLSKDPLISSKKIIRTLSDGEVLKLSGKKFEHIHDDYAINIAGQSGSYQSVILEDCFFEDNNACINIENVDIIVVSQCYFKSVGYCCSIDNCKSLEFIFNEVHNYGVLSAAEIDHNLRLSSVIKVANSEQIAHFKIEDNICDDSADTRRNFKPNTFREDRISIYRSQYIGDGSGSISRNRLRGSEANCESSSGGGIVFSQQCSNFEVRDNIVVNTGQYCFGNTNSNDILFDGNCGFISYKHDFNIQQHASKTDSHKNGPGVVSGIVVQSYGIGNIGTTVFRNNRVLAEVSNKSGTASAYHYNWMSAGNNIYENNSFDEDSPDGGELNHPGNEILPVDMFAGLTDGKYFSVRRNQEIYKL